MHLTPEAVDTAEVAVGSLNSSTFATLLDTSGKQVGLLHVHNRLNVPLEVTFAGKTTAITQIAANNSFTLDLRANGFCGSLGLVKGRYVGSGTSGSVLTTAFSA